MKKERPYHSIRKPNYIGGQEAFLKFLAENMVYPSEALEHKKDGTAHLKLEISDKGKVIKAQSLHRLGFGMDEEAERLALLMPFENTTERGMKIKHTKNIRIRFDVPKPVVEEMPVPPQEQPQFSFTITYENTPPPNEEKKDEDGYNYTIKFG